jgi:hypothetical protein
MPVLRLARSARPTRVAAGRVAAEAAARPLSGVLAVVDADERVAERVDPAQAEGVMKEVSGGDRCLIAAGAPLGDPLPPSPSAWRLRKSLRRSPLSSGGRFSETTHVGSWWAPRGKLARLEPSAHPCKGWGHPGVGAPRPKRRRWVAAGAPRRLAGCRRRARPCCKCPRGGSRRRDPHSVRCVVHQRAETRMSHGKLTASSWRGAAALPFTRITRKVARAGTPPLTPGGASTGGERRGTLPRLTRPLPAATKRRASRRSSSGRGGKRPARSPPGRGPAQ